jgi:16S rRNA (guanine527-N7)-methyltransferase
VTAALERLASGAEAVLGRPLLAIERDRFARYLQLLSAWQRVHRLVGSADPDWVVDHLLLDSLLFVQVLPASAVDILDFGSGAGIPGLPLKIVNDRLRMVLLEARRRRASFLTTAIRELGLRDIRVLDQRAEDAPPSLTGTFDAVVMRCVGTLEATFDAARRFVRPGGVIAAAAADARTAGSRPAEVRTVTTGSRTRTFSVRYI